MTVSYSNNNFKYTLEKQFVLLVNSFIKQRAINLRCKQTEKNLVLNYGNL